MFRLLLFTKGKKMEEADQKKKLHPSLAVGRSGRKNNACVSGDQNLPYVAL